ncbi:MAG: helix-turn-helix domain-containing protein [Rhodospirillales bacterium]|nr:helix-turn-helix domain-containing protein [Rhodospirillales bacterium]
MRSNTSTFVAPQEAAAIKVAILLLPGFSIGEFSQIADVLTLANQEEASERFQWEVYGVQEGRVESSAGLEVSCRACTALEGTAQNLVILGTPPFDPIEWKMIASAVRLCCRRGGAVTGVGDGVELLVQLGLLAGKRACAHWQARQALSEHHHDVDFTDRLFVIENAVGTCAGASTTIDFALDFVARLTSQAIADRIACRLNCEKRRSGQRSQRQVKLARFGTANRAFVSAIDVIQRMGNEALDPSRIAVEVGVSHRHLQRLFQRYLKRTPTECLRAHRLQHAKELLARTPMSITEVALATGFTNATHFTVRYSKAFGLCPSAERDARHQQ